MKKLFLLFAIGANIYLNAQGWIGSSTNNSLTSYNSNLQLTPIRVGVGTNSLTRTFEVNGTGRFGTLAPNLGSILDVAGGDNNQINVTHNTSHGLIIGYSGAQAYAGHPYTGTNAAALINVQDGPFFLGTSNTSRMTILGNGNVGVGVNTPTALFHTVGSLRFQNLSRNDNYSRILAQDVDGNVSWRDASTFGNSGSFWSLSGNNGTNPINNFIGTTDNQRLVFRTNNTEKLTILSSGFIGVGINNPIVQFANSTLHPANSAGFGTTVATGLDWNSSAQGYVASFYNSSNTNSENNGILVKTLNQGAGSKVFTVNAGAIGAGNDILTVLGNGRVGVGTNAPSHQLHLRDGALMIETPITGNNGILFKESGTTAADGQWGIQYNNDCNTSLKGLNFWRPGATNGVLYLADNNNVGIGTCSPSQRLHVAGNIQANTTLYTSDIRYKRDIKTIDNQLEKVNKIFPKSYLWKEEYKEKNFENILQFGFIAQELETVFPNIVNTDSEGYKSVNYTALIPIAIQAIKELNAKVDKQNNAVIENEELKSKISQLESKLAIQDEKFALLEKTISQLCESGCAGLEKKADADLLYQSIPNPTDKEAMINYYLTQDYGDAKLSIASAEGKVLQTIVLENKKGNHGIKVSLGELASGTYFYTLTAGNRVIDTKKLQIVK